MSSAGVPVGLALAVLAAARNNGAARAFLLDVDGTLAPIASRPDLARVPRTALVALDRIVRAGWRVAIVSGRSAASARRMVPVDGIDVFGSHGLETPEGVHLPRPDGQDLAGRFADVARRASTLVRAYPGVLLETKPLGLAFHDRALPSDRAGAWLRRLEAWLSGQSLVGLDVIRGKRVVELRPEGCGKHTVLEAWRPAREAPPRDRSLVAVGDDATDEDLFRALGDRGLSIRVGSTAEPTAARCRLESPKALEAFLSWITVLETGR